MFCYNVIIMFAVPKYPSKLSAKVLYMLIHCNTCWLVTVTTSLSDSSGVIEKFDECLE